MDDTRPPGDQDTTPIAHRNWLETVQPDPAYPDLELASALLLPVGFMQTLNRSSDPDVGVWWRIDAALASRSVQPADALPPRFDDTRLILPALLLRPCLELVADEERLLEVYRTWLRGFDRRRRADPIAMRRLLPWLEDIVPRRPERLPVRRAARVDGDEVAATTRAILDDALQAARGDLERTLQEYPHAAEIALSDADEAGLMPASHPRLSVLDDLAIARGRGAPRGHRLPSLAGAVYSMLPDARAMSSFSGVSQLRLDAEGARHGHLACRFAYELAIDAENQQPGEAVQRVRSKFDRREREASTGLYNQLRHQRDRSRGRPARRLVRRLAPYLIGDTALLARPIPAECLANSVDLAADGGIPTAVEHTVDLLQEWLHSPSFVETLELACAERWESIRFSLTPSADWNGFMRERFGRLLVMRVRFSPDNPGYRRAVAAVPGTRFGHTVDTWIAGIGSRSDVQERLLGSDDGDFIAGLRREAFLLVE